MAPDARIALFGGITGMTRPADAIVILILLATSTCGGVTTSGGGSSTGSGSPTGMEVEATSTAEDGAGVSRVSSTSGDAGPADSTSGDVEFECPGARWYEGDLVVDDTTVVDELSDVGGIAGDLVIGATTSLSDLEFLSCLEIVGGAIWIHDNAALTGLERLHSIDELTDYPPGPTHTVLFIDGNAVLPRVDSFSSLVTVGVVQVASNPALTEIELESVAEIGALWLGPNCRETWDNQPLTFIGQYPAVQRIDELRVKGQPFTTLDSLIDLVNSGVTIEAAYFSYNGYLGYPHRVHLASGHAMISPPRSSSDARSTAKISAETPHGQRTVMGRLTPRRGGGVSRRHDGSHLCEAKRSAGVKQMISEDEGIQYTASERRCPTFAHFDRNAIAASPSGRALNRGTARFRPMPAPPPSPAPQTLSRDRWPIQH